MKTDTVYKWKKSTLRVLSLLLLCALCIGLFTGVPYAETVATEKASVTDEKVLVPSPLSGRPVSEETAARRPVAIMIDDHPDARWQAGLKDADIIFEMFVEGGITRYLAIFQDTDDLRIDHSLSARSVY